MARNLLSSSIRSSLITSRSSTAATSVAYKPTTNRLTSRRAASIIASIAAIVMALSACGSGGGTTANSNAAGNSSESARTTLKWEASGEVTTMDSGKTYDTISGEAVGFFAEPLYRQNSKGDVEPALAASLPKVSDDGLTVDVTLRDGLKFSDGSPLTAADVVYAAKRVVDPATGSQSAKNLNYIKNATEITAGKTPVDQLGVKATSDTQLQFTLTAPNPYITQLLTDTLLSPVKQSFVEEKGKDYALSADNLLATGPFKLADWNGTNVNWKYVKNPNYWDAKNVSFNEIDVSVVKDVASKVNLFESGQIDGVHITGDYVKQYQGKKELVTVPSLRATNLELGISSNKNLQNLNLRKALSLAIDRKQLASAILNGEATPAVGVIPNGIAKNPETGKSIADDWGNLVPTDKDEAKTLFKKALGELGVDSVKFRLVTSDDDQSKKIGQYLQAQLQDTLPGLTIDVASVPSSVRFEEMMSYKFDLALGGWSGTWDPTSYVQQHETSYEHNHSQWKSQELTDLVNDLNTKDGNDFKLRWQHLEEANKYLIDNQVVIPLVQASSSYLINPKLSGYVTSSLGGTVDPAKAKFTN